MRFMVWAAMAMSLFAMAGCAPQMRDKESPVSDNVGTFRRLIDRQEFHQAYLLLPIVQEETEGTEEGASGLEYQLLLSAASETGQKDWVRILESPLIPLDRKLDLVREIDESAHKVVKE